MSNVRPITVGSYWINHYKLCGQHQTDYCGSIANGFAGEMRALGHTIGTIRSESSASPLQWSMATDSKTDGVDTVDFAVLATHGGTHGAEVPVTGWLYWVLATFASADGCIVSTIALNAQWHPPNAKAPVTAMRLGDGKLKWVLFDMCRSLQVGVINEKDQNAQAELKESNPGRNWGRCFDGLHMIFGFTGLSSDASWTASRGECFGHRVGRGEGLAESWTDEAASWWCDDAAVAMACGKDEADAMKRLKTESLAAVAPRLRAGEIGGYAYLWRG